MAEIITFSPPTTTPDVRFQVFDSVFLLHSSILSLSSTFFEASLSERWRPEDAGQPGQATAKSYYVAFEKDGSLYITGTEGDRQLLAETFRNLCHSELENQPWYRSSERCKNPLKRPCECEKEQQKNIREAFTNLFNIFYHRFRKEEASTLDQAKYILAVADFVGALSTVSVPLTAILMAYSEDDVDIEGLIAKEPVLMIEMAFKLRIKEIYNDAFVHLVGRWRAERDTLIEGIPSEAARRIEKESARIAHEQLDIIYGELLTIPQSEIDPYLEDLERTKKHSVLPRSLLARFEDTSETAEQLLENNLILRCGHDSGLNHEYLLCALIEDDDYPWDDSSRW